MLFNRNKNSKVTINRIGKINNHPYSFSKWITIFFITFAIGVIAIAVSLYYYTNSYELQNISAADQYHLIKSVSVAQKGIFALTSAVVVGLGILWFYLQRFILLPLKHVRKAAEHIIHGKLDQTVKIKAPMELKHLSESINDLSVNVQEILLFVWNQTESSLHCIDGEQYENLSTHVPTNTLNSVKNNLLELQRMISSFTLYDVHVEQKKVLGDTDND